MAETWDMLGKHHQERGRRQTVALADRFRNVLFASQPELLSTPARALFNSHASALGD